MIQNILWVDNNNARGEAAKRFTPDGEVLEIEWVHSTTSPLSSMANCVAVLYHANDIETDRKNEEPAWQYVEKWQGEKSSREVLLFSGDSCIAQNKVQYLNQNSQSQTRWRPVSEPINNAEDTTDWLSKYWNVVVEGDYHATGASLSGPCILAAIAVSLWPSASATERFSKLLEALKSDTAPCQRLQELVEKLSQVPAPDGDATLRERQQTLLRDIVEGKLASVSTSETHDL